MTGLYLHIPFCARKCPYCAFFSVPYRKGTVAAYTEAVKRNIAACGLTDRVDTVYFGGGTPSLLTAAQVSDILNTCAKYLHLAPEPEITLEYDPTGSRETYLRDLYAAGVDRLSIGTQSFSDRQLKLLGRTHTAQQGREAVLTAYAAGFRNISCDLMLAVPEQTAELLAETLQTLTELPVVHVSAYLLQVEEGTVLAGDAALLARCPDEDTAADLYLQTVHTLESAGLHQYEVSSFAREGFESRHNLKYWRCEPYFGIGAGAHACCFGKRSCVPEDIAAFLEAERQPEQLLSASPCDPEERLMLGLRLTEGVPSERLPGKQKIPALQKAGYLRERNGKIALTPEGFAVSNAVITELLT